MKRNYVNTESQAVFNNIKDILVSTEGTPLTMAIDALIQQNGGKYLDPDAYDCVATNVRDLLKQGEEA